MFNTTRRLASTVLLGALLAGGCAVSSEELPGEEEAVGELSEKLTMSASGHILYQSGVTDVEVASVASNRLDMFVARNGKVDVWHYTTGNVWQNLGQLTINNRSIKQVAAVANGSRLDVMLWTGSEVFWTFSTSPGSFSGAVKLNIPATRSSTNIALTSWGAGRLDLFWTTPSGNLGHAWFTNNTHAGTETGDTSSKKYLQPLPSGTLSPATLEAVSWGSGRIDIMFIGGDGKLQHHWYDRDNGGWGPSATPNRRSYGAYRFSQQENIQPLDLALTSMAPGKLDLIIQGGVPANQSNGDNKFYARFSNGWFLDNNRIRFENINPSGTTSRGVNSAVRWGSGKSRLDYFTATTHGVWQSYGTVF